MIGDGEGLSLGFCSIRPFVFFIHWILLHFIVCIFFAFFFFAVSEFTQQLSAIEDEHAQQLQLLIETFRKKNAELRKDRLFLSNFEHCSH